ncbi:hypothetical protein GCM10010833_08210 [Blastomonas aquatica]|uniref:Uncharacterized protein n=1 Tax=Blastomonas aquatica TaxID=1510276 RepID=A0ABQ1J1T1_9SPHN|nr:hypothetical protein GCM10010833_08210 [Blastomonas aquatica]
MLLSGGCRKQKLGVAIPPKWSAWSTADEDRPGDTDDTGGRHGSEIPPVETVSSRIEEKQFVCRNAAAALPDRHGTTDSVA